MEGNNGKRVLRVELDKEVKKVSITGMSSDEKVVMRQELNEDELEVATGGIVVPKVGVTKQGITPIVSTTCSNYGK